MSTVVEIRDTSLPEGVQGIVDRLPTVESIRDADCEVILRFDDSFIYHTGLVLLATWRKSFPGIPFLIDNRACKETTKRLLTNSGFRDIIERGVESPFSTRQIQGRVQIQPIVQGYSTEKAIREISSIFDEWGHVGNVEPLRVLLSELCENAFTHSEFQTPGYICADFHEANNRCEIAIADSGIGIRTSYLEGTNDDAKKRIANGASPIELAIDGLRSSKSSHYGYGLFIVRRLIEENRGRLTIISGEERLNVERYQKRRVLLKQPWTGTFVGLIIDMGNPLPLEEVYTEGVELQIPTRATKLGTSSTEPRGSDVPIVDLASQYGTQLLTRETGVLIRAEVATILARGVQVKVILDGVEDMTPSVADECFGKLAESLGSDAFSKRVLLPGGSPILTRLIGFVVQNRIGGAAS